MRRETRLVFDRESIERPLDGGNPELARHNDAIALQYLSQLERDNIEVRVREVLTQRLAQRRAVAGGHRGNSQHERPHSAAKIGRRRHNLQGNTRRYAHANWRWRT